MLGWAYWWADVSILQAATQIPEIDPDLHPKSCPSSWPARLLPLDHGKMSTYTRELFMNLPNSR
jgi:flagellar biosynthesis protein FliQ